MGYTCGSPTSGRGSIPLEALELPAPPEHVRVPGPHVIEVHLSGGHVEEVPWDFARHFADDMYRARSEESARRGRRLFGERLRALRSEKGVTQQELANRAGINRVTVARIESGGQLPRYRTVVALAEGLGVPIDRLLVG